ncbi:hypothetical protein E2562_033721 [Oryza meyeriana var. granulata]|uniref:Uncharacterized protein n=1 Tax=Oryza meyeriana var. granulata TaxID=110450 RepID=A0A6G1CAK5_9ORYZ|nr:hypothetical protein E2562_033721 [Oryza meyeriana var. granulata]
MWAIGGGLEPCVRQCEEEPAARRQRPQHVVAPFAPAVGVDEGKRPAAVMLSTDRVVEHGVDPASLCFVNHTTDCGLEELSLSLSPSRHIMVRG